MTEEQKGFSGIWITKGALVLMVTLIPTSIVLLLFQSLAWIDLPLAAHVILLSSLSFFLGTCFLIVRSKIKAFVYSLVVGFSMTFVMILLAGLRLLSLTPVPLLGNGFNALALALGVITFTIYIAKPSGTGSRQGLITQSNTAISSGGLSVFRRDPEIVKAVELEVLPRQYLEGYEKSISAEEVSRLFVTVARTLWSIPFSFRIQRRNRGTKVLFLTWATDPVTLNNQVQHLYDTLSQSKMPFIFGRPLPFSGFESTEGQRAMLAHISGVPLSVMDDAQVKDPLSAMASVLKGLDNGMYQISSERASMNQSELRALQEEHRRKVEASQTTVSRETRGLLSGPRHESSTKVDVGALREAEELERRIERLSQGRLQDVRVTCAVWSNDIAVADGEVRRMAEALVGSLRPDSAKRDLTWRLSHNKREVMQVIKGLPAGDSELLTHEETANYLVIPRTDLGVPVERRGSFSSGTKQQPRPATLETGRRPILYRSKASPDVIRLGCALNELGAELPDAQVAIRIDDLSYHLLIVGNTRSGKTTSLLSIVGQAILKGINPVILSPIKAGEMWVLPRYFPDTRIYTLGRKDVANLSMNIWEPPENVSTQTWVDKLVEIWTLYMPSDVVINMHLEDVFYTMYRECGWDLETDSKGRPIRLTDLETAMQKVIASLSYGDEVMANVRGALEARVKSILRKPRLVEMLDVDSGLTVKELLAHPTVIDMDSLSRKDKILFMGIFAAAISEYMLAPKNASKRLTNLLVLEEAHYLLKQSQIDSDGTASTRTQAVHDFIGMLHALGGKGLGVILVDQSPSRLVPEAVSLPVNMIVHALTNDEDRRLVGGHARCDEEQTDHIGGMQVGETVVYLQREAEPKNVKMFTLQQLLRLEDRSIPLDDAELRENMVRLCSSSPGVHKNAPSGPARSEPLGLEERVHRAVQDSSFLEVAQDCLRRRDGEALADLFRTTNNEFGNGTKASMLILLEHAFRVFPVSRHYSTIHAAVEILSGDKTT